MRRAAATVEGTRRRSDIPEDVERAILRGTPHVVVSLYESEKNGKGYLGVVLYYP